MRFSSRLMVSSAISGGQSARPGIKMVKLLMYFFKIDEMLRLQSDSSVFLLKKHIGEPREIVTDKLRSYGVAHRELSGAPSPETIHNMEKYANNRAELSHQPTRVRERVMRRSDVSEFKSVKQAQRFLNTHAAVYNLFNLGRHLVSAETYRYFRLRSFASWKNAAMI